MVRADRLHAEVKLGLRPLSMDPGLGEASHDGCLVAP